LYDRIFFAEPVSTSAENALAASVLGAALDAGA